jgi:uncharacterized 2Fe-2S/4Fe-4S cluster protein (DUF4445 family)
MPGIAGFVGADITALLLTLPEDETLRLVMDLGTNGELAIGAAGRYLTASAACGPALEGGSLQCGMRGAAGAVAGVTFSGDALSCAVIGGGAAAGICGSGVVDLVAGLLAQGLLEPSGRLLSRTEYLRCCPGSPLAEHLGERDGQPAFYLTARVWLGQKDIRQIQLAKGAIAAGLLALLEASGHALAEVEEVVLSGAFGSRMPAASALRIGLLPSVPAAKIRAVGNGAGYGAQLSLRDRRLRPRAEQLARDARHWDLAEDPVFARLYIQEMNFPQQNGFIG